MESTGESPGSGRNNGEGQWANRHCDFALGRCGVCEGT